MKEDVEKLEAELEVTQDYYAKREMEISMQLGSEAGSRVQSEELHAKQMAKENRHTVLTLESEPYRANSARLAVPECRFSGTFEPETAQS